MEIAIPLLLAAIVIAIMGYLYVKSIQTFKKNDYGKRKKSKR